MSDELSSLRTRLASAEQNLRLIQERKSAYVLAEDIPLQLIKNERALELTIARLTARIAALNSEGSADAAENGRGSSKRWTIFLGHAQQDKPFVNWLYHKLRSADLTVWYDENEILVGDSIPAKVSEGLVESELLLVLLSQAAVDAGWVREELEPKLLSQIYGREVIVLPIMLGQVAFADIPPILRGKQSIQFPPEGSDEKFRELLADIEQHLRRRGLLQRRTINGIPRGASARHNPFGLRGGVDPARFIIPARLIRELTEDIVKQQSISIIGARMIGKTSLLKFLISERCQSHYQDEQGNRADLCFVYIDLQEHSGKRRDEFVPLLAGAMSEHLSQGERFAGTTHQQAMSWIKTTVGRLQSSTRRWVLAFDEFDRVCEMEGLDETLFDELRSLLQHYQIGFVTASRRKLIDLPLPLPVTTSPFFNLFKEVFLTVWDEATTRKLMLRPRGTPLHVFSADDVLLMSSITGRHPLLLQVGCYHLFNERRTDTGTASAEGTTEQFLQSYMQEAEGVYRYYLQHELDAIERAWLYDCWYALANDNAAALKDLQRNTAQRKNHTIRIKLARLGLAVGTVGPIVLPRGMQLFLSSQDRQ